MKKLLIGIITLLLVLMAFSSCSQSENTGDETTAPENSQNQTPNNETTAPDNSETNSPETNIPETNTPETNAPETNPPESNVPEQKKSYEEIAKEVIAGKWGNGPERKTRLEAAGYDYLPIQDLVNYMTNPNKYNAGEPKTQIEIKEYMDILVTFFYTPYKTGDDLSNYPIDTFCLRVLCNARGSLNFVQMNPNIYQQMEVKGDDLRNVISLLIKDIDSSKYNNNLYSVNLGRGGNWGANYSINPNIPLQISETDTTITVIANIGGTDGYSFDDKNTQTLEYTFNKVIYQDFTFYQLVEVKESTTNSAN